MLIINNDEYRLRPHTSKEGSFEFRHRHWEAYGIQEWIAYDGFVDNVMTLLVDIGKTIETYTITWTPDGDGSGSGDGGGVDSPLPPTTFANGVGNIWSINVLNPNWDQQHSLVDEKGNATYVWGNQENPSSEIKFVFKDIDTSNAYFYDKNSLGEVSIPITWNSPSSPDRNYEGTFTFQSIAEKGGAEVVVTITNTNFEEAKKP